MAIKTIFKWSVFMCISLTWISLSGTGTVSYGKDVDKKDAFTGQSIDRSWTIPDEGQENVNLANNLNYGGTIAQTENLWHIDGSSILMEERNRYKSNYQTPPVELASFKEQSKATGETKARIGSASSESAILSTMEDFIELAKYGKAIHVLAMLLLGFGFLMTYVRKYGYSALTATYIAVSIALPYYMYLRVAGLFGEPAEFTMDRFILAEFCAASLLIAMGAFLGRLKMAQYMIMALMFVPSYMLNEWIMLDNGMGIIPKGQLIDTGGSIVIHQFGAYFGLGVIVRMTTREDFLKKIESDKISNQFSLLGSMVLWIFWPSFCCAPAEISKMPLAAINTVISLCGATLTTYVTSVMIRKKIGIEDIANAVLAGGVAIGSSCAHTTPQASFVVGLLAGILSTVGFAVIQPRLQNVLKGIDTCGVHNLHGMPGIMGGLAAIFITQEALPGFQIKGILITFVIAWITGLAAGTLVSLFGYRKDSYNDAVEFIVEEEH